ncbi:DUF6515 family protein [Oceaniferula spumae]
MKTIQYTKTVVLSSVLLGLGSIGAFAKSHDHRNDRGRSSVQKHNHSDHGRVARLPSSHKAVKYGGVTYHVSGDSCYVRSGSGYVRVQKPKALTNHYHSASKRYGRVISRLPHGCREVKIRGVVYHYHNGTYYRPHGKSWISVNHR